MQSPPWPQQAATFALFYFGYFGYIGVFSPYASLYFADHGVSATQIGVLMALMQVMRIVGPTFWGWVADRRQQRVAVLQLTGVASAMSVTALVAGHHFAHFFCVMVLLNLFVSAQGPLSEALIIAEMRGDLTHYGRLRLWGSVGFVVAVTLAGPVLDYFGIRVLPWIAFTLLGVMLVASFRMAEATAVQKDRMAGSVIPILLRKDVIAFFFSTFCMLAAHAALYVYFSLYLAQIGYSNALIGFLWSLGVLVEILFFFYQAPLFRRFGVRNLMIASLLFAVARFLLIGFGAQSLLILVVAQALHAATFGTHHSAVIASLQSWFPGAMQVRGQALYSSIAYGLGGTFGALLLGPLWESFGAVTVYVVAAVLALVGCAAAVLCYRWQAEVFNESREAT